jgi:hypothetical protein
LVPIPTTEAKLLEGKRLKEEDLDFLTPGMTKQEVAERLGSPTVIWEDARVFAYEWVVRQGELVGIAITPAPVPVWGDIPKTYRLLIQFDEQDKILRFERKSSTFQSLPDALREFVAQPETAPSVPPSVEH